MTAVRFHGQRDVRIDEVPIPECKPGHVKIAPKMCGICGTELYEDLAGASVIPKPGQPHPITKETLPLTLGHEFSGVIEEVGEGVTNLKVGDKVSVEPNIHDGTCHRCERGLRNCCSQLGLVGLSGFGGGLCEHVVVPAAFAKALGDVSLEAGALVEPLAVGYHAVKISPYKDGDNVLVVGGGPIGLAVVLALVRKKCQNIIVSARGIERKEIAQRFGAHHVIDADTVDVLAEVNRLTNDVGVDVAFDAAGVQAALDTAIKATKAGGTMVYTAGDVEDVIDAIGKGEIKPVDMITKIINFDRVVEEGFHALILDKTSQVKILVDVEALLH